MRVRIRPHAGVDKDCGSFEVIHEGGPTWFYWDNDKTRRLRPEAMTEEQALEAAKAFARSVNVG